MSEGHPILHGKVSQAKNLLPYRRFKLMQRAAREYVNKCLGYKVELRSVSQNGGILLANSKSLSFSTLMFGKAQEQLD